MRIMGLDVGTKTIGVALGDELGITARPLKTIKRVSKERDFQGLLDLIEEYGVKEVVVGVPLSLDGSEGPMAQAVLIFVEELKARTSAVITTWDERFSTAAVTRVMIEADLSRAKRKKVVDRAAAAYILQGYLDFKRGAP